MVNSPDSPHTVGVAAPTIEEGGTGEVRLGPDLGNLTVTEVLGLVGRPGDMIFVIGVIFLLGLPTPVMGEVPPTADECCIPDEVSLICAEPSHSLIIGST